MMNVEGFYTLGDHLGSISITVDETGAVVAELRYKAWGETRYANGDTPTSWRYTGQRQEEGLGLYYYRARWYDPALGRFTQADTIVPEPNNSQEYDRYAYVNNNPIVKTDPSGHFTEDQIKKIFGFDKDVSWRKVLALFREGGKYEGRWGWLEVLRRAEEGDSVLVTWDYGFVTHNWGTPFHGYLRMELNDDGTLMLFSNSGITLDQEVAAINGNAYQLKDLKSLDFIGINLDTYWATAAICDPYVKNRFSADDFDEFGAGLDLAGIGSGLLGHPGVSAGINMYDMSRDVYQYGQNPSDANLADLAVDIESYQTEQIWKIPVFGDAISLFLNFAYSFRMSP